MPSEKAKKMTTEELCQWLRKIKVSDDYIKLFEEEDIDGSVLAQYEFNDLEDLGISKGFVRKKIITKFRNIS